MPFLWKDALNPLRDVLRFSRTHKSALQRWIDLELARVKGEQLVGAVAMAVHIRPWEETKAILDKRTDISATALTLLDFEPHHPACAWARTRAKKQTWFRWAQHTPLNEVFGRGLESLDRKQEKTRVEIVWIAPMLMRANWLSAAINSAARRLRSTNRENDRTGLPANLYSKFQFATYNCTQVGTATLGENCSGLGPNAVPRGDRRHFASNASAHSLHLFSNNFSRRFALRIPKDPHLKFSLSVSSFFSETHPSGFINNYSRDISQRHLSDYFSLAFWLSISLGSSQDLLSISPQDLSLYSRLEVSLDATDVSLRKMSLRTSIPMGVPSAIALRTNFDHTGASASDELHTYTAEILFTIIAETYAGIMTIPGLDLPGTATFLALARVQNRWLNLMFTPLVDYTLTHGPLADHPDRHALLLTYGLIQYQTTWEWPDCPHWRTWMSSPPPEHWLSAHVWHLIRSIQDPDDPTHRARATEALDRNDWPEVAQALRDNTLVPATPEHLALFDRGDSSDDPSP